MNDMVIGDLVRKLHLTLERASAISESEREQLLQLSADLQAVLAQPGAPRGPHQGIVDRLMAAITRLEVSHPDLASTMELAVKKLADMGI
jgi:hypothetical protein